MTRREVFDWLIDLTIISLIAVVMFSFLFHQAIQHERAELKRIEQRKERTR